MFPVRCMSCGKPIAQFWEPFLVKTKNRTEKVKETLDEMGVERYCCRQQFMGHVENTETLARLKRN